MDESVGTTEGALSVWECSFPCVATLRNERRQGERRGRVGERREGDKPIS